MNVCAYNAFLYEPSIQLLNCMCSLLIIYWGLFSFAVVVQHCVTIYTVLIYDLISVG